MSFYVGSLLFTAIASFLLGGFVYAQGRSKLSNASLALLSLAIGSWCFGQFMGEVVGPKQAVLFWTRFNLAGAIFIPVFYLLFILAFTNQIEENKFWLKWAFGAAGVFLLLDFTPWFVAEVAPRLGYRFYPVPGVVYPFFAFYLLTFFGVGFWKLKKFLESSRGSSRNQARYVFFASLVGFWGGITAFFPVFNINLPVVSHFALPLYLLITSYAIVKHNLLEIHVVIREGLVYSALTIFFAGFYTIAILLANRIFQSFVRANEFLAMILVVFASVLVFQPLRQRIQWGVDRLFFRGEYYYQKTIKDLSAENLKLYRSLLQADKLAALGTIAAGMAHEIKNPLASIKGLTQVLPENLEDPEFIQKFLEIVPRQIDRINRIVEDLLTFGRPQELIITELKVSEVIEEVLRLVENQCQKAGIEVIKEFRSQVPIRGDKGKLSQAFLNIILNAIQAMPRGGKLWVGCREFKEGEVEVEISDSGLGIPEDKISRIFDPFFTTKEKGSGMGLAVTYRIIKEHGGRIEVESEPGAGTTFKIYLSHGAIQN